jgi:hypothetical protein
VVGVDVIVGVTDEALGLQYGSWAPERSIFVRPNDTKTNVIDKEWRVIQLQLPAANIKESSAAWAMRGISNGATSILLLEPRIVHNFINFETNSKEIFRSSRRGPIALGGKPSEQMVS